MNKLLLPALFLTMFPLASYGGNTIGATISETLTTREGILLVSLSAPHSTPSCGSNLKYRYAISSANKTAIAAALMAQSTGKLVDVYGLETCDIWGDTESVLYFNVR